MPHLITNAYYLFLLKRINCLESYDLKVGLGIFLTKLGDFSGNIKCNFIIFTYYSLLSKNLKQKNGIRECRI